MPAEEELAFADALAYVKSHQLCMIYYSIKTLAKHLGFEWRDKEPSRAASIEWYHRWVDACSASIPTPPTRGQSQAQGD